MSEHIIEFHHDERGIVKTWDEVGELIRCEDCKFYDGEYCHSEDLDLCLEPMGFSGALFCPPEDFYCAYGKGKEEEN